MWLSSGSVMVVAVQVPCSATERTASFMAWLLCVVETMRLQQGHQVVVTHFVVVDQRAARRFDDAHAAALALAGGHAEGRRGWPGRPATAAITSMPCSSSIMRAQCVASTRVHLAARVHQPRRPGAALRQRAWG
jgi:hypothetical protein